MAASEVTGSVMATVAGRLEKRRSDVDTEATDAERAGNW